MFVLFSRRNRQISQFRSLARTHYTYNLVKRRNKPRCRIRKLLSHSIHDLYLSMVQILFNLTVPNLLNIHVTSWASLERILSLFFQIKNKFIFELPWWLEVFHHRRNYGNLMVVGISWGWGWRFLVRRFADWLQGESGGWVVGTKVSLHVFGFYLGAGKETLFLILLIGSTNVSSGVGHEFFYLLW